MLNHEDLKKCATKTNKFELMDYVSIAIANEWTDDMIIKNLRKEHYKAKQVRKEIKLFFEYYDCTEDKNRKAVEYNGKIYRSITEFREEMDLSPSSFYHMLSKGKVRYAC